ncbi:hypothetical protein C440_04858 [Haloferax mucosum ATCC BAA-1512]|uniref:Uncharacterized protein n=1 Tax=Haloferax mucosum ATCC BAA-1512 TaxID=662479 RepID=M0ILW2_9EURY|nr:hypothetical protein [Haloferax mucosum]ELZ96449.1 hypothetical protein C440_04858 [Haloferax mucosum ATCC BAA-1512]
MARKPSRNRRQADKKLLAAHKQVLALWSERTLKELDPLVIHDPFGKPETLGDLEEEFYEARRRELERVHLEPISWIATSEFRTNVPDDWEAIVVSRGE